MLKSPIAAVALLLCGAMLHTLASAQTYYTIQML
jgi:hypothetical protein